MPPRGLKRKNGANDEKCEAVIGVHPTAEIARFNPKQDTVVGIEILNALLHDLDIQVELRCQRIQDEADRVKAALWTKHSVQKLKLPKSVRCMPLRQFFDGYGADVRVVMYDAVQCKTNAFDEDFSNSDEPKTVVKGSRDKLQSSTAHSNLVSRDYLVSGASAEMCIETPQKNDGHTMVMPTPGTAARLARHGEMMLSMNGSPLIIDEKALQRMSVLQELEKDVASIAAEKPALLKEDVKNVTKGKLQTIQERINQLMSELD